MASAICLKSFCGVLSSDPTAWQLQVVLRTRRGDTRINVLLTAELWALLSDGDGLRQAYDWKGASSIKPCLKHYNVFMKGSDLAGRMQDGVEISEHDHKKFKKLERHHLDEFCELISVAAARRGSRGGAGRLDHLEKALGFNWNPHGMIFDADLRARVDLMAVACVDWVHSLLQHGVVDNEICKFLEACRNKIDLRVDDLKKYLKGAFMFPKYVRRAGGNNLWKWFDEHHFGHPDAEKLGCMATDMLTLYSLLRHRFETEVGEVETLRLERASFDAACQLVDVFMMTRRGVIDLGRAASEVRIAARAHLVAHKAAYGDDGIVPKDHWPFDVAETFERDSAKPQRTWHVFDALVMERLHLRVKGLVEHIDDPSRFERTLLAGSSNEQIRRLNIGQRQGGLQGRTHQDGTTFWATDVSVWGMSISVGDIVWMGDLCGEVAACALDSRDGTHLLAVEMLDVTARVSQHSVRVTHSGRFRMLPVQDCNQAAAWYNAEGDEKGLVIILM